jgi:hypothetical protein
MRWDFSYNSGYVSGLHNYAFSHFYNCQKFTPYHGKITHLNTTTTMATTLSPHTHLLPPHPSHRARDLHRLRLPRRHKCNGLLRKALGLRTYISHPILISPPTNLTSQRSAPSAPNASPQTQSGPAPANAHTSPTTSPASTNKSSAPHRCGRRCPSGSATA